MCQHWFKAIFLLLFVPSFLPVADDLRLNACVFKWPSEILIKLEDNTTRLAIRREQTEDHIQTRFVN